MDVYQCRRGSDMSVLLCLLSLVARTAPYLTFNDSVIPNHAYVDLSLMMYPGNDDATADISSTVICHTDLTTCCRSQAGPDQGDWYFPDGTVLPGAGSDNVNSHPITERKRNQLVRLQRGPPTATGTVPDGIYHCDIETVAVNSADNTARETVYVGVYGSGGDITIPDGMTFTAGSDLNGASPQFALTCISTGGPTTTVTWTRGSEMLTGATVLNDAETAQYTHTLTVTGRLGGLYTCNVSNDKPSQDSATFTVQVASAPTNLIAVQEGLTSIRVSWSPPTPLGDTTGYRIYYSGGSSGSVNVSGGSTDNYLLTSLVMETSYNISIVATSQHFFSDTSTPLIPVPCQPSVAVIVTAATSISLFWSVPCGSVVDSYEVVWQRDTSGECSDEDEGNTTITDGSTRYVIMGLAGISSYTIAVRATNAAGSGAVSDAVTAMTWVAAPSAAPTSVRVSEVTSSSITVQWGAVDCIHRNGNITGYSVRYGVQGSGSTQTMSVSGGSVTEATISRRTPFTAYSIEVAAVNILGTGSYSAVLQMQVVVPVLSVNSTIATSIFLSWTSAVPVVDSYEVVWQRDTTGECSDEDKNSTTVTNDSTSHDIMGLEEDSSYTITVTVTTGAGSTAVSDAVTAMTLEAAPSAAPTSVNDSEVTSSSITVQWGAVDCIHRNGDITGYSVRYGVQGSAVGVRIVEMVSGDSSGGMYVISGLSAATMYTVEVAAVNNADTGMYSDLLTSVTSVATPVVSLASPAEAFTVSLSWTSEGSEVDYEVLWQRDTSGECSDEDEGNTTITDGSTRYVIMGLAGISSYTITVRATNAAGTALSDPLTVMTTEAAPSAPPASVGASNVIPTSFNLQWEMVPCIHHNGDITDYSVRYGVQGSGSTQTMSVTDMETTITGLTSDTSYAVEVAGVNVNGIGEYNDSLIVNTPQTVYLNFGGENLPTHGYVAISQLNNTDTALVCRTDRAGGDSDAGWFNPDETMIEFNANSSQGFYSSEDTDGIRLLLGTGIPVEGIYTCRATDSSSNTQTVFVGLYNEDGGRVMVDEEIDFELNSELTAVDAQFTLTCISTGGPATTVTWTRDSEEAPGQRRSVLDNATTAQYTHILTVTGRLGGLYTCTVSNSIPSKDTANQTLEVASDPTNLIAVQEGLTSIRVSWSPPTPLGNTTGYRIYYSGGSSGSVNVSGSSSSEVLADLVEGGSYSVSLTATSQHLPSAPLTQSLQLVLATSSSIVVIAGAGVLAILVVIFLVIILCVVCRSRWYHNGEEVEVTGAPQPELPWYHDGEEVVADYSKELAGHGEGTILCQQTGTAIPVAMFGSHVERNHAGQNQAFKDEYQDLYNGDDKSTTIAVNPENKTKNRFCNICVYDDHRVLLRPLEGYEDCQSDYINASYVDGYSQPAKFLATQGPLPRTTVDFWRLVWQERAPIVVMITNLVEGTETKCHQYWPDKGSVKFGPFKVSIIDQQILADYIIRTLVLQLTGSFDMRVKHFHFTAAWPDHGVPDYAMPILAFHRRVISENQPDKGPIVVHCSAGVGRTGTFITIDHVLEQTMRENVVDIPGTINKIRRQRMKLVQTVEQYTFIHDAILELVMCEDTQITSSNLCTTIKKLEGKGFSNQFSLLEQVSPSPDEVTAVLAGRNPDRNRSTQFLPADKWRVALRGDHPDYIHAVHVSGYKQQRAFIIAQSPMQSTTRDFWKMISDRKCGVIVMLCDLVEAGKEVCYQYWPRGGSQTYGEFTVELLGEEKFNGFSLRTFGAFNSKTGKAHQVSQFHITNWAPDGCCANLKTVTDVIEEVGMVQRTTGNKPIVVHCIDTVSRSGMFCAIATTIERCKTEGVVDVFQVVKALRVQKPGAVRTVLQYQIIFEAVLEYLFALYY